MHYAPMWLLLKPVAFPVLSGVLVIPYSYSKVPGGVSGLFSQRALRSSDLCVKVLHGGAEPRSAAPSSLPAPGSQMWRKPFPKLFQINSSCGLGHKHCQGKSGIALLAEMVSFRRKKGLGMPLNCLYLWVMTKKGKPTFQSQMSPYEWLQLPAALTPKSGRASQG